jgi:hypothetical protein
MWEIFAGHPPFDDREHNENLILNIIFNGIRPPLLSNMPDDYAEMMQKCWDVDHQIDQLLKNSGNFLRIN